MHFTSCRQNTKGGRIYLQRIPWNFSNLQSYALRYKILHTSVPGGIGELTADDVELGQANKWA
jgi:hypothetical protein